MSKLCKKGNQKLHAIARISKYLNEDMLKLVMTTFIQSQFNYCPLVWMFHNRKLNNKINRLHERALRIVYKNENLTFQEILDKDHSVTIHHRNLQRLATEMYKIKNKESSLSVTSAGTRDSSTLDDFSVKTIKQIYHGEQATLKIKNSYY